jgi:hypothetical protein
VGGGHAPGTGRRGTTEFPVGWSRERIMDAVVDVAKDPDEVPRRLHNGVWRTVGVRGGVQIVVLVAADGAVRTAYPVSGPGVIRNPERAADPATLTVDDLVAGRIGDAATQLLEALADRVPAEDLAVYRELYHVGEWEELAAVVAAQVEAEGLPLSPEGRDHLAVLRAAAG